MAEKPAASYRYVGNHADQLANGRPVAPGDFIELTDEEIREPYNEAHILDGRLIGTNEAGEHQISLAQSRAARRAAGEEAEDNPDESKEG